MSSARRRKKALRTLATMMGQYRNRAQIVAKPTPDGCGVLVFEQSITVPASVAPLVRRLARRAGCIIEPVPSG